MKTNKQKRATLRFNGGYPIALCLNCSTIMCYVCYLGNNEDDDERFWVVNVLHPNSIDGLKFGDKIPLYCKNCTVKQLMIEKFEY